MKTLDPAIKDIGVRLEPDVSIRALAHEVWRDLVASSKRKNLLANSLGRALGALWYVSWHDGHLIVQRQQGAPAGSALRLSTSLLPMQGSPKVICDGQSICADGEPEDDNLKNELAYVMGKIAKYLNWTAVVLHGSALFQNRFQHHALHERDAYTWAFETSRLLREQRPAAIDWDGVAEELEDLGISQERPFSSPLRVLLAHLLKWAYDPAHRSKSWKLSIENSRDELKEILERNPGLRQRIPFLFEASYRRARRDAASETPLDEADFPRSRPWSFSQVTEETFWPDSVRRAKN